MTVRAAGTAAVLSILAACAAPPRLAPVLPEPLASGERALVDLGAPDGGLAVISDLVAFDGRLWLVESRVPLAENGASIWTFEPGRGFVRMLDDAFSQGFLRGDVIAGRLYVADGDPRGFAGGVVHVFTSVSEPPRTTTVDEAVHNFQVVEFDGEVYVTGGLADGSWGLSRFDGDTQRWTVAARGSHLRLKYAAVFDGALYGTLFPRNGAELLRLDRTLNPTDLSLTPGVGTGLDLEVLRDRLYATGIGDAGPYAVRFDPGGFTPVPLQGLSGAVFDFADHDGVLYAVGCDATRSYLYGSLDGLTFTRLLEWDDLRFGFAPGSDGPSNADGRPSLASFQGRLYLGSSTNGRLYRLED